MEKEIYTIYLPALLTLLITRLVVFIVIKLMDRQLKKMNNHEKKLSLAKHLVMAIIYTIGIGIAASFIPKLKSLSTSIFASSGILAIVIGFASQQAFSNMVSGVFILAFKPFRLGDLLRIPGKEIIGIVEDITLRHTVIKNFENKRIIIPNSVIGGEVIENANIIEEKVCKFFEIGISYNSNVDKAMSIIKATAFMHKDFIDNRTFEEANSGEEAIPVRIVAFADSAVMLKAWIWSKNNTAGNRMIWDLNYQIKKRFDEEGIEIPYPHRTVYFRKEGESEKKEKRN